MAHETPTQRLQSALNLLNALEQAKTFGLGRGDEEEKEQAERARMHLIEDVRKALRDFNASRDKSAEEKRRAPQANTGPTMDQLWEERDRDQRRKGRI